MFGARAPVNKMAIRVKPVGVLGHGRTQHSIHWTAGTAAPRRATRFAVEPFANAWLRVFSASKPDPHSAHLPLTLALGVRCEHKVGD